MKLGSALTALPDFLCKQAATLAFTGRIIARPLLSLSPRGSLALAIPPYGVCPTKSFCHNRYCAPCPRLAALEITQNLA